MRGSFVWAKILSDVESAWSQQAGSSMGGGCPAGKFTRSKRRRLPTIENHHVYFSIFILYFNIELHKQFNKYAAPDIRYIRFATYIQYIQYKLVYTRIY